MRRDARLQSIHKVEVMCQIFLSWAPNGEEWPKNALAASLPNKVLLVPKGYEVLDINCMILK
jgi:hypothetical protein